MNPYRVFEFASYLIDFYLLIISLRIILSWFAGDLNMPGVDLLRRITDPYLNLFRGTGFLRVGFIDFSPLLGIFFLIFVSNLFKTYASGLISVSVTLAVLVQTVFYGVSSIISLFAIIALIRIVGLFIHASSVETLWYRLDSFLQPLVSRIFSKILPGKSIPWGNALGLFLALCFLVSILLRVAAGPIIGLIQRIPF